MPYKRYTPIEQTLVGMPTHTRLPTTRPIAIYYRQSTDAQFGNISTSMQTIDMAAYLQSCGWSESQVLMIDMDAGVSGSTKIDERPGMSQLFGLITTGKIGAVACQDEDRLFRDVTQIQVNIFIEACRAANVLVLTPSMVYDFANEMTGVFHARQFRFKSEMAAEYINSVIRGKLHRAKRRLLMSGRWGGPGMPVGYMADMRKTMPNGSPNEHWRKFAIFEPYAAVTREYFRLFLANAGNLRHTHRHIQAHGPYYPDLKQTPPPEGYRVVYRIKSNQGRLFPTRDGLKSIFTNAQFIGHWMVNGAIMLWDNHPPLIDQETFLRAFNYLSKVGLTGNENEHYVQIQQNVRPTLDEKRPVERPLCAGMIVGQDKGEWRNIGCNWTASLQHYTYVLWTKHSGEYVWGKKACTIDAEIERVVQKRLLATFEPAVWAATVGQLADVYQQQHRLNQAQLTHLEIIMANLVASLEALTNSQMIAATQQRFEVAQTEYARLKSRLADQEAEEAQLAELMALKQSCDPALSNWPQLTRQEKRVILQAFVRRIEATPLADHGLRLVVRWKDDSHDEIVFNRQATTGTTWTPEDAARLRTVVKTAKTQVEVAQAFPTRRWNAIRQRYYLQNSESQKFRFRPKVMKDNESYVDYLNRTGQTDSLLDMSSESHSKTKRRGGQD